MWEKEFVLKFGGIFVNVLFLKVSNLIYSHVGKRKKQQQQKNLKNMKCLPKKTMIVWAFRFHLFSNTSWIYICYDFLNILCSNGYVRQKQWILLWKFDWKSKVLRQNSQTRGLFENNLKNSWKSWCNFEKKAIFVFKTPILALIFFYKIPEKSWRWEYKFDAKMKTQP